MGNLSFTKRGWGSFLAVSMAVGVGGCSRNSSSDEVQIVKEDGRACVQGVVVDGVTGQRVALKSGVKDNVGQGVFVYARNKILGHATLVDNNQSDPNARKDLFGEYYLCGFPLNNEWPIYVAQEGYHPYESVVKVDEQKAVTKEGLQLSAQNNYPTAIHNITLYPTNAQAQDVRLTLVYRGQVLKGAPVSVKSKTLGGQIPVEGARSRMVPLNLVSDDNGQVLISGKLLVVGQTYNFKVSPPTGEYNWVQSESTFTTALKSNDLKLADRPLEVVADVASGIKAPLLKLSSLKHNQYESRAKVVLYFDREITLGDQTRNATVEIYDPNSGSSSSRRTEPRSAVVITVDRATMTLTLSDSVLQSLSRTASVTYRGIHVKPANEELENYQALVSDQTVILNPN